MSASGNDNERSLSRQAVNTEVLFIEGHHMETGDVRSECTVVMKAMAEVFVMHAHNITSPITYHYQPSPIRKLHSRPMENIIWSKTNIAFERNAIAPTPF